MDALMPADMAFLFTNPLRTNHTDGTVQHEDLLNFRKEKDEFKSVLDLTKVNLTYRCIGGITIDDFISAITPNDSYIQPTLLHLSAHAELQDDQTSILFEGRDDYLTSTPINHDELYRLIDELGLPVTGEESGDPEKPNIWQSPVQLLILNCCHGDKIAHFLHKHLKIPHIIASPDKVSDVDTIKAMRAFYNALFRPSHLSLQTLFNQTLRNPKVNFKLYPEGPGSHDQIIYFDQKIQSLSKTAPDLTYSREQMIFPDLKPGTPVQLPPLDVAFTPVNLPTQMVGHVSRLETTLASSWGDSFQVMAQYLVFVNPPGQSFSFGKRTHLDILLTYLADRPRFPIASIHCISDQKTPEALKTTLESTIEKAETILNEMVQKENDDYFTSLLAIRREYTIIYLPNISSPPILAALHDYIATLEATRKKNLLFYLTTTLSTAQFGSWNPLIVKPLIPSELAFYFIKSCPHLQHRTADLNTIYEEYARNSPSGSQPLAEIEDPYERALTGLPYIKIFVNSIAQPLSFNVLKSMVAQYNAGKALSELDTKPAANGLASPSTVAVGAFGQSPGVFGQSPRVVGGFGAFGSPAHKPNPNANNNVLPHSSLMPNSTRQGPAATAANHNNGINNNILPTPTNSNTMNNNNSNPQNIIGHMNNNSNPRPITNTLIPPSLQPQSSVAEAVQYGPPSLTSNMPLNLPPSSQPPSTTSPAVSTTTTNIPPLIQSNQINTTNSGPKQPQQPPQSSTPQPTATLSQHSGGSGTNPTYLSPSAILLRAYHDPNQCQTLQSFVQFIQQITTQSTTTPLDANEIKFITSQLEPLYPRQNHQNQHVAPQIITTIGSYIDLCSESYQKNLQTSLNVNNPSVPLTPPFSLQDLRVQGYCRFMPYMSIRRLSNEQFDNSQSPVSLCFYHEDVQKTITKLKSFSESKPTIIVQGVCYIMRTAVRDGRVGWDNLFCVVGNNGRVYVDARGKFNEFLSFKTTFDKLASNRPFIKLHRDTPIEDKQ